MSWPDLRPTERTVKTGLGCFAVVYVLAAIASLALVVGVIYVAIHFLQRLW